MKILWIGHGSAPADEGINCGSHAFHALGRPEAPRQPPDYRPLIVQQFPPSRPALPELQRIARQQAGNGIMYCVARIAAPRKAKLHVGKAEPLQAAPQPGRVAAAPPDRGSGPRGCPTASLATGDAP